jgi:hypothetical protein
MYMVMVPVGISPAQYLATLRTSYTVSLASSRALVLRYSF